MLTNSPYFGYRAENSLRTMGISKAISPSSRNICEAAVPRVLLGGYREMVDADFSERYIIASASIIHFFSSRWLFMKWSTGAKSMGAMRLAPLDLDYLFDFALWLTKFCSTLRVGNNHVIVPSNIKAGDICCRDFCDDFFGQCVFALCYPLGFTPAALGGVFKLTCSNV